MGRKKYVVMMAAGSGTRMGAQMPKQFLELDGKAILRRTIEIFLEACPDISVINHKCTSSMKAVDREEST